MAQIGADFDADVKRDGSESVEDKLVVCCMGGKSAGHHPAV